MKKYLLLGISLLLVKGLFVTGLAASARNEAPKPAPSSKPAKATKKKAKGKRAGEKEAEGTEAHDRFEADTVIKSQYRLHGEPLEVDPD